MFEFTFIYPPSPLSANIFTSPKDCIICKSKSQKLLKNLYLITTKVSLLPFSI